MDSERIGSVAKSNYKAVGWRYENNETAAVSRTITSNLLALEDAPIESKADRFSIREFSIRDFFVFLQANSSSSILAKEFGKCNIPETQ